MDTIYFLAYVSTATHPYAERELLALLAQSRESNARLAITGMLLYAPGCPPEKGTFIQVLEGPRAGVQALYVKICRDERHKECTILDEGTLFQRRFADWSMGFRNLDARPLSVEGFSPIFFQKLPLARIVAEPDPILRALYSFAGRLD